MNDFEDYLQINLANQLQRSGCSIKNGKFIVSSEIEKYLKKKIQNKSIA